MKLEGVQVSDSAAWRSVLRTVNRIRVGWLTAVTLVVLSLYIECNVRVSPYEASHGSLKPDDAVLVVASIAVMSPHRSRKNPGGRQGQNI